MKTLRQQLKDLSDKISATGEVTFQQELELKRLDEIACERQVVADGSAFDEIFDLRAEIAALLDIDSAIVA